METQEFESFINPYLSQIASVFNQKSGQFMIVGPDRSILDYVIRQFTKSYYSDEISSSAEEVLSTYKTVFVTKNKDFQPDKKIFVLNLELTSSIEYQSLLYYYLELPLEYECFVCLISSSSQCINMFEKRVMSRFKNKIFYIPFFVSENEKPSSCKAIQRGVEDKLEIKSESCSVSAADIKLQRIIRNTQLTRQNLDLALKYKLEKFSSKFVLDLFQPIHIVLLTIAFYKKLNSKSCYQQFKQAVLNTPELKRADPVKILYCFFDLIDFRILNSSGCVLMDKGEFKEYVAKSCPLYIKKLVANYDRIAK